MDRSVQFALALISLLIVLIVIIKVPRLQAELAILSNTVSPDAGPGLINEYRKTILQTIGGMVVAFGLYLTWRRIRATEGQLRVSEDGMITERFAKAVEQLESEKIAVVLGGIYSLERIARDSPKDHQTVMQVLMAYLRDRSDELTTAAVASQPGENNIDIHTDLIRFSKLPPIKPSAIIQAVLSILGSRDIKSENSFQVDLQGTDLRYFSNTKFLHFPRASFLGADLSHVQLTVCNMHKAKLTYANLSHAQLCGSDLSFAEMSYCNLLGTNLLNANLVNATLNGANLKGANLKGVILRGASLNGCFSHPITNNEIMILSEAKSLENLKPQWLLNELMKLFPEKCGQLSSSELDSTDQPEPNHDTTPSA